MSIVSTHIKAEFVSGDDIAIWKCSISPSAPERIRHLRSGKEPLADVMLIPVEDTIEGELHQWIMYAVRVNHPEIVRQLDRDRTPDVEHDHGLVTARDDGHTHCLDCRDDDGGPDPGAKVWDRETLEHKPATEMFDEVNMCIHELLVHMIHEETDGVMVPLDADDEPVIDELQTRAFEDVFPPNPKEADR